MLVRVALGADHAGFALKELGEEEYKLEVTSGYVDELLPEYQALRPAGAK